MHLYELSINDLKYSSNEALLPITHKFTQFYVVYLLIQEHQGFLVILSRIEQTVFQDWSLVNSNFNSNAPVPVIWSLILVSFYLSDE